MPLTRYHTRSEYGLADPDLYRAADKDDPEALLEGVAMAGLVGILRQLGDLAEFAAEMFHDLHEEVMATAARSHGVMARVQQLEADFPSIEKALLCQTDHSPYFPKTGVQWHPTLQLEQNVVTRGDLPRCVMDSYEECRGPPRLFLLDKFDIAGAGACLKRYTDPSFVRLETLSYEASWDDIQREKKSQKGKRRGSHWRNGGTTENALSSHAKLHELFLEEHLEARHSDPARIVKLKSRKLDGYSPFSKSGESYMEKFVQSCVDNKTGYQIITSNPELLTWNIDSARDVVSELPEISMMGAQERSHEETRAEFSFPNEQENASNINLHVGLIEKDIETVPESYNGEVLGTTVKLDSQTNLNGKSGDLQYRSYFEDLTSEADNFVDAPATMESETETDDDGRAKNGSGAFKDVNYHVNSEVDEIEDPPQFSDFHSIGYMPVSENGQSSFGKRSVSFSSSDAASISMDDHSDREKSSVCLPSTVSFKSEVVDSLSHTTPSDNREYHDLHFQKSVSSSNVDGQASFSSHSTSSSPRLVSKNAKSCTSTVQSLAPEVVKTSPESGLDRIEGGNDESRVDPIDASVSGASFDVKNLSFFSRASSSSSASEETRYDTTIEKNYRVDYSSNIVYSGTSPQMFVDSLTTKQLPVADNAIKTNSAVAFSENLAKLGSDPKSCDGSETGKLLPESVALGMEVSPDMPSKVAGPITVDEIHSKDTLDDEIDHIKGTDAVADVDSQSLAAEISAEHSCALGNEAAAVSVSESHEDTLKNEVSMYSEVESSKPTSDINSGVEELEADASSTSSKYDEQIRDIPAEFSSSYLDDEGCHDHPQMDDATTEILPSVEPAMSENHAGTYCEDASHAITLSSPVNTYQSSSEAGEICQEKFVESDGTIQADNNPESEKIMKNILFDVSSEALDVDPDNNDLTSCESLIPLPSLVQRERDTETETESSCKSTLIDNCIDSSPVDNLNLSESTLEQSAKGQIPWASHALVDEELLESSVCQTSEFVPQSEAMHSPKQALNLEPAFPSFGLISETTPTDQDEIPPLPPLPPMQWRLGKVPHSNGSTFMGESLETSSSPFLAEPASGSSLNTETGERPSWLPVSLGSDKSEQLPEELLNNGSEKPLQSSSQFPTTSTGLNSHDDSFVTQITQSAFLSATLPTVLNQDPIEDFSSEENNLLADHAPQNHELDLSQESSLQLPQAPSVGSEYIKDETCSHVSEKSIGDHQSTKVEYTGHTIIPRVLNGETAEPSNSPVQMIIPLSVGDAMWPVSAFTVAPTLDGNQPEEVPTVKLPRPRSPLVDAVAAHDRRTMKKVSERVRPPVKQKEDDKDSLLAQIRSKSVNLKPAVVTRPNIQTGPKTNLRVAAILEKANTIRQAMVGSDEDDDSDGWSDS